MKANNHYKIPKAKILGRAAYENLGLFYRDHEDQTEHWIFTQKPTTLPV
ncbi:hypothetical protein [Emticicia sp. W12TSBA100-4]